MEKKNKKKTVKIPMSQLDIAKKIEVEIPLKPLSIVKKEEVEINVEGQKQKNERLKK